MQIDTEDGRWWYQGPCPDCGKAVGNDGEITQCLGCGRVF